MSLLNDDRLRKFFQGRRRFQLAWFFSILLIFSAKHYPSFFGIALCFLGASLRFISSGFLRKRSNLAVGGPYAYTRNPLYLGTFFMALGASLSVGAVLLTLVMGFVFFLNYHYVIEGEEKMLPAFFGAPYGLYCSLVPRFWPQFSSPGRETLRSINSDPKVFRFSFSLAKENKAFEAYATLIAIMAGMMLLVFLKTKLGLIHAHH